MTATIPINEPIEIISGTTLKFTKNLENYKPEDGWTLTYIFANLDSKKEIIASDNSDSTHLVSSTLTGWTSCVYKWQAFVSKASERYLVDSGSLNVIADFAQHDRIDTRSHVKKALDALEAMIEGKATKDQTSYTISTPEGSSRTLSRLSFNEVLDAHKYYKNLYENEQAKERRKNGLPSKHVTKVAFRRS